MLQDSELLHTILNEVQEAVPFELEGGDPFLDLLRRRVLIQSTGGLEALGLRGQTLAKVGNAILALLHFDLGIGQLVLDPRQPFHHEAFLGRERVRRLRPHHHGEPCRSQKTLKRLFRLINPQI